MVPGLEFLVPRKRVRDFEFVDIIQCDCLLWPCKCFYCVHDCVWLIIMVL